MNQRLAPIAPIIGISLLIGALGYVVFARTPTQETSKESASSLQPAAQPVTPAGPTIKANGLEDSITVGSSDTVTITVTFDVGNYPTSVAVDWWLIASANLNLWYYMDSTLAWKEAAFSGNNYTVFHPVYQGPLFNLSSTTVLPAMTLPAGTYYFWFAVDYPADGVLDPYGAILYDQVTVTVPETTEAPANTNSPLGTNPDEITYFGTEWAFVDAFKASGAWRNSDGGSTAIDTDSSGWVRSLQSGQVVFTPIFSDLTPPSGTYIVLYEGEGTIEYSGYAVKDTQASRAGRDVVTVTPKMNDFFWLSISATNSSNYIKNIRVLMPEKEGGTGATFESNYATQIFHPLFLERVKRYSTIRFMQWMIYNILPNPAPQTWDGRPEATDARWSVEDKGVPVEIMVALANRLHADAWFNMPHLADDTYVREFATYVRDNLDSSLKAYIEYTNEAWNTAFTQHQYMLQQGAGLSSDSFEGAMRFYSQRSVEIFRIWSSVFGSNARLVRVLASHNEIPERGVMVMDWKDAYREADAFAVGAYFIVDPADFDRIRNFTAEQLIQDLEATAIPLVATYTKAHVDNARARGLPLIAYEGGEDLANYDEPKGTALDSLFVAANRHALMQEAYTMHLNLWRSNGGTLFLHLMDAGSYQHSNNGALETLTQEHSPKYDALMNFIAANPKWW